MLARQRAKFNERLIWIEDVLQWCEKFGMELQLWPNLDEYESRIAHRPAIKAALAAEGLLDRHRYRRSA